MTEQSAESLSNSPECPGIGSRKALILFVTVTVALKLLGASGYDYGDSALMLARSLEIDLSPGPSGHPLLYALLHYPAKLFGQTGINWMNTAFGAGAMVLAVATIARLARQELDWKLAIALLSLPLCSHTLLLKTTLPDVYTIQALLTMAMLYCIVRGEQERRIRFWYLFFAFFLGLQVANHLWVVFSLPMAVFWGVSLVVRRRLSLPLLIAGGVLAVLASGLYAFPSLTILFREGFDTWLSVATGSGGVSGKFHGYALREIPKALALSVGMTVYQFPLLAFFAFPGWLILWRENRTLALTLLVLFIPNFLESTLYKENHAYEVMLTHYQALMLVIGYGVLRSRVFEHISKSVQARIKLGSTGLIALLGLTAAPVWGTAFAIQHFGIMRLAPASDYAFRHEALHFLIPVHPDYRGGNKYLAACAEKLETNAVVLGDWSRHAVLTRLERETEFAGEVLIVESTAERKRFKELLSKQAAKLYITGKSTPMNELLERFEHTLTPIEVEGAEVPVLYRVESPSAATRSLE